MCSDTTKGSHIENVRYNHITVNSLNSFSLSLSVSEAPNDDLIIMLQCIDAMLTRRKKQVTLQRAMAFIKRLSMLSMHTLPNASVGILAASRAALHVSMFPDHFLHSVLLAYFV